MRDLVGWDLSGTPANLWLLFRDQLFRTCHDATERQVVVSGWMFQPPLRELAVVSHTVSQKALSLGPNLLE